MGKGIPGITRGLCKESEIVGEGEITVMWTAQMLIRRLPLPFD
jgi:hypothetical protein